MASPESKPARCGAPGRAWDDAGSRPKKITRPSASWPDALLEMGANACTETGGESTCARDGQHGLPEQDGTMEKKQVVFRSNRHFDDKPDINIGQPLS